MPALIVILLGLVLIAELANGTAPLLSFVNPETIGVIAIGAICLGGLILGIRK